MGNPTATDASRAKAGTLSKGKKGTARKDIAPATGFFALPPPRPKYYEEDGLRKVAPYMDRTTEYYEWAIESGIILVNNEKSTPDRVLRNGDLISNIMHRHEPPVAAGPVRILYDGRLPGNDGETLVVEKPGSMPVHPTGRYNFNTLLEILKYDYDLPLVHTSNRLDRLTSGVMICALTADASKKLGAWFGGRRNHEGGVKKEYVARCRGRFPDGEVICEEPLLTIDRQIGVNVVHPEGRDSKTIFTRLSYHERSNTSVVHCRPITGRSHQIRVHLQFLGHPIANDPIYQNTAAWGASGGKGGVFGEDRGGDVTDRAERKMRGEAFMAKEKAATQPLSNGDLDNSSVLPAPPIAPPRFNRAGDLHADYVRANKADAADDAHASDLDRKPHDLRLTDAAAKAITALREVKEQSDGFARARDLEGIERARVKGVGAIDLAALPHAQVPAGQEQNVASEEARHLRDVEDGFCSTCFVPLVPDPRPEQLFIWLHAMRYTTIEWDWSSELPYWAEASYEVPLSSLLS
ncbi:hypothetical protein BMF94_6411 [Rhodotorula taiwanensis]|uniref:Pseudouridine synthase RsuA/RluA-like domain-containing protein n=1 Tax=Rhodotorula taiwanensis TaxID=741276 RepID=A0A2S5B137_9BASI|nr:hypothetical protein BMF94_6411 [Rhodotorula taiwanensis]